MSGDLETGTAVPDTDSQADALQDQTSREPDTSTLDGLLATAKAWHKEDEEHAKNWRTDAKEDFDFVAGHQWSDEDKEILREQLRPEITFNRISPTVESVIGIEIGNRREVRYIPRQLGDEVVDDVLTAAAEWSRDQCDAEDEESDAFFDVVTCGMGWVDTRMDYEEEPDGKIIEERLDPLEMLWDAAARKRNLADARRTWRIRTIPIEDARMLAKAHAKPGDDDIEDEDLDATWARLEERKEPHNADPQVAYSGRSGAEVDRQKRTEKRVTLAHLQWWERETYYRVSFNGRVESVSEDDFPTLKARADKLTAAGLIQQPMQAVKQIRKVYKQALIGAKVLSTGPGPVEGHFSWECITGKRDHNKGTWYGLVRAMKDPQRWANKWLSQSLHVLNSNAKGGIFAERGAFDNDRQAEDSYARADQITWLKSGGINKIEPKTPPAIPNSLGDLLQYAISSIRDVSGVNVELLGMREADQPASLEESRKQSGMAILASLFDALRRFRKRQGRILLHYIQEYISDGRLVRIAGKEVGQPAQYLPLVRRPDLGEYEVIVDEQATSPNQKEKIWATLMQMLPMLGQTLDASDWAILLQYSPLPQSVVEKWQEKQQQDQQQQAPIQQQMQQIQLMIGQTKAQLQAAQAMLAQAQAGKAANEANMPGSSGGTEIQLEHQREMQRQQSESDTDRLKIAADLTARREEIASRAHTERGWMGVDSRTKEHDTAVQAVTKTHDARLNAAAKIATAHIAARAKERTAAKQPAKT